MTNSAEARARQSCLPQAGKPGNVASLGFPVVFLAGPRLRAASLGLLPLAEANVMGRLGAGESRFQCLPLLWPYFNV